ncbi:hypothetical protein NPIL_665921 [Nephila pilipes]|uniref:Tc1-like transposase DDE domain-containing protein n=1 Tax=Nephila pilipes TaxID=299642 RepID=A0A8X6IFN5_NEPPI|nr:hypothetical protein NPIL_665921 [Nephila pilipes]
MRTQVYYSKCHSDCEARGRLCYDLGCDLVVFKRPYNSRRSRNCNAVNTTFYPTMCILSFPSGDSTFQNDNCPIHTARSVQAWFQEHEVIHLPWPF